MAAPVEKEYAREKLLVSAERIMTFVVLGLGLGVLQRLVRKYASAPWNGRLISGTITAVLLLGLLLLAAQFGYYLPQR